MASGRGSLGRKSPPFDAKAERERQRDKWRYTPPGGESYAALAERIATWLATRRGDMFIASHGGVARAMMYVLGGVDPQIAPNADVHQGRALVFEPNGRFSWVG